MQLNESFLIDTLIDTLPDRQCELTSHLVLGGKSDLESRLLSVPLIYHSLKTALGPTVSPLEGAGAGPKGQVSRRPIRATTCSTALVFFLFLLVLLHAAL